MNTRKIFVRVGSISLVVMLLAAAYPTLADMAPPAEPPGVNLGPDRGPTQVRMLAETVVMEIQPGSGDSLGKALVTADFTLRNLGSEKETMAARFPISANGYFEQPEVENLQVRVNGNAVRTRRTMGPDPYDSYWDLVPWAEFDVTFPPGEDIVVRITYTVEGNGWAPFVTFNYILSTGAGWENSIGSADIIVRLPYEANSKNVLLNEDGWSPTSPGAVMEGRNIQWHFDNLEPTPEDNLRVELVMPAVWQKVLKEQAILAENPQDGEALGRLGKLYKETAFTPKQMRHDPGGQALYELSVDAYEKCLLLKPNDAEWHAGFAELYIWRYNDTRWDNAEDYSDLLRAAELLKRAFEINPESPKTVELLQELEWRGVVNRQAGEYDFLLLTATPSVAATATHLVLGTPTITSQPTDTPTTIQLVETPMILEATQISATAALSTEAAPAGTPTLAASEPIQVTTPVEEPASEPLPGGSLCGAGLLVLPWMVLTSAISYRKRRGR